MAETHRWRDMRQRKAELRIIDYAEFHNELLAAMEMEYDSLNKGIAIQAHPPPLSGPRKTECDVVNAVLRPQDRPPAAKVARLARRASLGLDLFTDYTTVIERT